jgi:regulator of replication initiation timing
MDKKISDIVRMTSANFSELLQRVADHIEELEFENEQLRKRLEAYEPEIKDVN